MTKSKMVGGMSFRDLTMLNDSLLTKQAWRLLNDKNSLFYRIFKALFFPQCTIMEAADSRSGSYPWKSILHGHDVILRRARWRVGNGKSIQIWSHKWLPVKHPPMISSPAVDVLLDTETQDNRTMTCWMDSLFPKRPISSGASPYLLLKQKTNSIGL